MGLPAVFCTRRGIAPDANATGGAPTPPAIVAAQRAPTTASSTSARARDIRAGDGEERARESGAPGARGGRAKDLRPPRARNG